MGNELYERSVLGAPQKWIFDTSTSGTIQSFRASAFMKHSDSLTAWPIHSFLMSFSLKLHPFRYPAPEQRYVAKLSQPRYGSMQ